MTEEQLEKEVTASIAVAASGFAPTGLEGASHSVLVTAVRNEAPFLLEWIAYHKLIGFSRIVVLSNTSDDGTEEILAALAAAGEITHHHVDPVVGQSPQFAARMVFDETEGYDHGAWYLWLDADEFLNVHLGQRRLPDLLAALEGVDGIHLNWRIFGSSGHNRFPGRYVSKDFPGASRRAFPPNRETKSLFRKTESIAGFALKPARRPRLATNHGLTASDFLAGNGRPLVPETTVTQKWFEGDNSVRTNTVLPAEMGWALAQINHYSVRTPEFYALKAGRGRGAGRIGGKHSVRHTAEYFASHDQNGQSDLSISVWEEPVAERMALLAGIPAVAEAVRRSDSLVRAILAGGDAVAAAPVQVGEPVAPLPTTPKFGMTFPRKEAALVREMYAKASVILEYGSGGSTLLAATLGKAVVSVESDKAWAGALSLRLAGVSDSATVHYVDVGPTEKWGTPSRPRFHLRFHRYPLSVWDRPDLGDPDLVLIDGRFRAACLAAVRMRARRPTTVLFDDYIDRPHYAGVERFAVKEATVGRMARFTVTPGPIPPDMLTEVVGWFADPR